MDKINLEQLTVLKIVVRGLGEDEVEEYIQSKMKYIVLNFFGNIISLDLSNTLLGGSIPTEIGLLNALKKLSLQSNDIKGLIPREVGQLSSLTELVLSNNKLSGSIPSELGRLSELKLLVLSDNHLSGSVPPEIGQLSAMKKLSLHNNKLEGPLPREIGQLSTLTELVLSDNKLSGSIPVELGWLSELIELKLYNNKLSGSVPAEIKNLKKLIKADFSGNFHLKCDASMFPFGCDVDTSGTFMIRTKPVKTSFQKLLIVQYVVLGYADLATDILAIVELFSIQNVVPAMINLFFIVLGILLGIYNSSGTQMDIFLNLTQLSILVAGYKTLRAGRQTEDLVSCKKIDAVTRSISSAIFQLYSLLENLENYAVGSYGFRVLVASVAIAIVSASITLSGLHKKAGNKLISYQFFVLNLYYISEVLLRVLVISVAFVSIKWHALIAVGVDILVRGVGVASSAGADISSLCLWIGSDIAPENPSFWVVGLCLSVIESLTVITLMFMLGPEASMIAHGTAVKVSLIMLCTFVTKCVLYWYIDRMEKATEEEESEPTIALVMGKI